MQTSVGQDADTDRDNQHHRNRGCRRGGHTASPAHQPGDRAAYALQQRPPDLKLSPQVILEAGARARGLEGVVELPLERLELEVLVVVHAICSLADSRSAFNARWYSILAASSLQLMSVPTSSKLRPECRSEMASRCRSGSRATWSSRALYLMRSSAVPAGSSSLIGWCSMVRRSRSRRPWARKWSRVAFLAIRNSHAAGVVLRVSNRP